MHKKWIFLILKHICKYVYNIYLCALKNMEQFSETNYYNCSPIKSLSSANSPSKREATPGRGGKR